MTECVIMIVKTTCFEWFHFFYWFSNSGSRGWDLAHILMSFGDPGETFSDFLVSCRQVWNLMVFPGYPGATQVETTPPGKVDFMGSGQLPRSCFSSCPEANKSSISADFMGSRQLPRSWFSICLEACKSSISADFMGSRQLPRSWFPSCLEAGFPVAYKQVNQAFRQVEGNLWPTLNS